MQGQIEQSSSLDGSKVDDWRSDSNQQPIEAGQTNR